MKIHIHNTIHMDGETEIINEVHDCQWTSKGDYEYIVHQNSQNEKVVIKVSDKELVMTRFSHPKSVMRFLAANFDMASIPTPMGLQRLVTKTSRFYLDRDKQEVQLAYELLPEPDSPQALAAYDLKISWR